MRATRLTPLATTLLLVTLGVAGCSDDSATEAETGSSPSASSSPSEDESPAGTPGDSTQTREPTRPFIEIAFEDGEVTPNGERVEVPLGEPIDLVITADVAGELHVHATPEQELAYEAGTTTIPLTIDQPGIVEVESHDPALVVVQLEVR